jgi:hypothetical protein
MPDFVMVMRGAASHGSWEAYIEKLIASGGFRGGSSLGNGLSVTRGQVDGESDITGFIRLSVENLEAAKALLDGNPLYEAGGTVDLLEEIPE